MKTITVVAPTCQRINEHAIAIERTAGAIPHRTEKLLLSPAPPTIPFSGRWKAIPDWMPDGRWEMSDVSKFMLAGLGDHIPTDVCITVHWDGYGIHADRWTDRFLDYDYIGAPWPPWMVSNPVGRVGNGGFSLRSKRWLETGKTAPAYQDEPEDVFCCQKYLEHYCARGCQVAPIDLALQFSVEHGIPEYPGWPSRQSFGFHGWFNPDRESYRIIPDTAD